MGATNSGNEMEKGVGVDNLYSGGFKANGIDE